MLADLRCYLARTLSRLCREAGLAQNALALRANLSRQLIHVIEAGQHPAPTWTTIQKLALGLAVPTDVFRDPALASAAALPRRGGGRPHLPPFPRRRRYLVRYRDDRGRIRELVFDGQGCLTAAGS
jgi:DNA-binding XRE family transcriptional regulator